MTRPGSRSLGPRDAGSEQCGRERAGEFGRLERKLRGVAGTPFLKIGVAGHGETNNQG